MEKQRINRNSEFGRRFLIALLLIFCAPQLFAQTLTRQQINELRLTPESSQNLYTKTDIKFVVTIPKVRPSQIHVTSTDQKNDISFKTMRKIESYDENGTMLEIWYNFAKKGTFQLAPISLMIQNSNRTIKFEPVTITDDPASMNPRIVLVFEDGTFVYSDEAKYKTPLFTIPTGKKLRFTVNLQYAIQLVQFNWEIPQNSIFTCTKKYEFTQIKYRERVYSHDLIPVADFEWTGLVPGTQKLPKFKLNAAGYGGYRSDLMLPEITINFTQKAENENSSTDNDIFSSAFFQEEFPAQQKTKVYLSKKDCEELARLYTWERNTFFTYLKNRKERINFEKNHGIISSTENLFPAILLYISIFMILISTIALISAARKKHKIRILLFSTLLILGIGILIYCSAKRSERYGICTGCRIYSVPQDNAEAFSEIETGSRVRILEKTEKWYYVELGETGGWCSSENIYIIK
ncbi:MAG: hypothetical protein J6X84_05045 [Treponema sp.]|nr:hypothetical protein [Treponema sp.]